MKRLLALFCLLALTACDGDGGAVVTVAGNTMGTTYQVTAVGPPDGVTAEMLSADIETVLAEVNGRLSNWIGESEISRFNAARSVDPVTPSPDLTAVMEEAFYLHQLSGGRFDVTLAPLIDLWGFGSTRKPGEIPDDDAIAAALKAVGTTKVLAFDASVPRLRKKVPDATVNLSAIAKGYGVDRIADVLRRRGVENFLVEIGGDLICRGKNPSGEDWRIGIEKPDAKTRTIQLVVPVSGLGMATSGDYRNFVEKDGRRYSHIIDPRTGRPVTHDLASVTVLADTAMRADGLATAFLVLGAEKGLEIADKTGIAAYFIVREDGSFSERMSKPFVKLRARAK